MNSEIIIPLPSASNQTEPLIEEPAFTKPEQDLADIKVGHGLQTVDTFGITKQERERIIPQLQYAYGIQFTEGVTAVPFPSFTTRKCLLTDTQARVYFLKERPSYSVDPERQRVTSMLQTILAEQLTFIPPIIKTVDDKPHAEIEGKIMYLTPFIQGDLFMGRLEQSISSANALGLMHKAAQSIPPEVETETTTQSLQIMVGWAEELDFPDTNLKKKVISKMRYLGNKYEVSQEGLYGWMHADVAPYNTIYHGNEVLAINDFDNVMYGPLAKDLAIMLLDHTALNYAGPTSSFRTPIRTVVETDRMDQMLQAYLLSSENNMRDLIDLPNQLTSMWVEYMALGLLRGDFSLKNVNEALEFSDNLYHNTAMVVRNHLQRVE